MCMFIAIDEKGNLYYKAVAYPFLFACHSMLGIKLKRRNRILQVGGFEKQLNTTSSSNILPFSKEDPHFQVLPCFT